MIARDKTGQETGRMTPLDEDGHGRGAGPVRAGSADQQGSDLRRSDQRIPDEQTGSRHRAVDAPISYDYDYDDADGHRILRVRPTRQQWQDLPAVLALATRLDADRDGCFKV
ncbi:hypothetical protein E4U42_007796, partial [Claviceps africana]